MNILEKEQAEAKIIAEIKTCLYGWQEEMRGKATTTETIGDLAAACAYSHAMRVIGLPLPEPYDTASLCNLYSLYYDTHQDYADKMPIDWLVGLERLAGKPVDLRALGKSIAELVHVSRDVYEMEVPDGAYLYSHNHPAIVASRSMQFTQEELDQAAEFDDPELFERCMRETDEQEDARGAEE